MTEFEPCVSISRSAMGKLLRILSIGIGVLVTMHIVFTLIFPEMSWQFYRLFYLDYESNIPAWYSSVLWFIASICAYQCVRLERDKLNRGMWSLITLGLLILSVDEVAMIHENIFRFFLTDNLRDELLSRHVFSLGWAVLATPFILLTVVGLSFMFRQCLKGSKKAAIFVFAGMLMVLLGGWILELAMYYLKQFPLKPLWHAQLIAEEALEMAGVLLMIKGLMVHIAVLHRRRDRQSEQGAGQTSISEAA